MNLGEEAVPPGGVDEPKAAGPRMAAEVIKAELELIRLRRETAYGMSAYRRTKRPRTGSRRSTWIDG